MGDQLNGGRKMLDESRKESSPHLGFCRHGALLGDVEGGGRQGGGVGGGGGDHVGW